MDAIVLAQASMAHLQEELGGITHKPVLASFPLAMAELERRVAA
ncbi:hypothetical protein ACE7GA_13170 [Roseomonas sp. CCTCC AB2023176]